MEKADSFEFSFKPLSEGLGFHSTSEAKQMQIRPVETSTYFRLPPKPSTHFRPTAETVPVEKSARFKSTGFLKAIKILSAYITDTAINVSLCTVILAVSLWKFGISPNQLFTDNSIFYTGIFLVVFNILLITGQNIAAGTSLGKQFFKA